MSSGIARAVVQIMHECSKVAFARSGHVDVLRTGVARVAQHLDDDILYASDIMLRLASLGLSNTKTNVALAEVLLDSKATFAAH